MKTLEEKIVLIQTLLEHRHIPWVQEIVRIQEQYPSISIRIDEQPYYDLGLNWDLFVHEGN